MRSAKYSSSRAAFAFVSASIFVWPAMGAEPLPDFSGIWGRNWHHMEQPLSGPGPILGRPRTGEGQPAVGDYTSPLLTPEASALLKKRAEIALSGAAIPDPINQCWPEPIPFLLAHQDGMQMLQQEDEVILFYDGDHKVRRVRMNVPHPPHVTPTWQGDSVGHYEGDTLVIDTVGQKVGPLSMVDLFGTPFSPALHVVERYRLIDGKAAREAQEKHESNYFPPGQTVNLVGENGRGDLDPDLTKKGLQVEITVEDPAMFTTPWSALVTYRPATGRWPEAACAERLSIIGMVSQMPIADKPDF